MPTIKDVAREAGVSPATVSYVINESAPVSLGTRDRVLAAIQRLNYRPNQLARNLQGQRTMALAFGLPARPAFELGVVLPAAVRAAAELGYALLVQAPASDGTLPSLAAGRVDGALVFAHEPPGDLPHIWATLPPTGALAPAVVLDGALGARRAVLAWAATNQRRIAIVLPPSTEPGAARWYLGYRRALLAAGLPYDPSLVVEPDGVMSAVAETAQLVLAAAPDAVLVVDAGLAVALATTLRSAAPAVAVMAGSDGHLAASAGLSALSWPLEAWAAALVETLVDLLNDAGAAVLPRQYLAPSLIFRSSVEH